MARTKRSRNPSEGEEEEGRQRRKLRGQGGDGREKWRKEGRKEVGQ